MRNLHNINLELIPAGVRAFCSLHLGAKYIFSLKEKRLWVNGLLNTKGNMVDDKWLNIQIRDISKAYIYSYQKNVDLIPNNLTIVEKFDEKLT